MKQILQPSTSKLADKVKGVPFSEVKAKAFRDPDVLEAYMAEDGKAKKPIYTITYNGISDVIK